MTRIYRGASVGVVTVLACLGGSHGRATAAEASMIGEHIAPSRVIEISERATRTGGAPSQTRTMLRNGAAVNAFSIVRCTLAPGGFDRLESKGENFILVADLQKRSESTWNRIRTVDRLSRKITPSSAYIAGHPELLSSGALPPLYVNEAVLALDSFLHEGDVAAWLAFNDVSSDRAYGLDLKRAETDGRAVMSINLQDLLVTSTGAAVERYRARHGDKVRFRLLAAAYSPPQQRQVDDYLELSDTAKAIAGGLFRAVDGVAAPSPRDRALVTAAMKIQYAGDEAGFSKAEATYAALPKSAREFIERLLNERQDLYAIRFADIVTEEEQVTLDVEAFGFKLYVEPTVAFGRREGSGGSVDGFNPIKTTPSIGSNVYLTYDGRSASRRVLNWLPGVHLSLLGLGDGVGAEFTLAAVHPVLPSLRRYGGVFFGWHGLRQRAWGLTFSPNINFRAMVGKETTGASEQDSGANSGDPAD